jgi:hypothetical protein
MAISRVHRLDQVAQRFDTHPEGLGQVDLVEEDLAAHPEQVAHGHRHTSFCQDGVDLRLEVVRRWTSLPR